MDGDDYIKGVKITGGITFVLIFLGSWIYCIATYGFLLGVGLGWLPALITGAILGTIAGALWPLIVLGIVGIIILILHNK